MADLLTDVRSVLITTPLYWQHITQYFPEDLLRRQPLPGEWSALECLQHLVQMDQSVLPVRVKAILAGESFPPFLPSTQSTPLSDVAAVDLAAEFMALRTENIQLFDTLTPADLSKQGQHLQFGWVAMETQLAEWAAHDMMHTVQAQQALMQPYIAQVGPWMPYFATHLADKSKVNSLD